MIHIFPHIIYEVRKNEYNGERLRPMILLFWRFNGQRLNLTISNSLVRFVRRGMNYSKDLRIHSPAVDFFSAWYNLVKPHQSLRIEIKWAKEMDAATPAMAEGLTDMYGA